MSTTSPERLADVTGIDESAVSHGQTTKSVYVYEAPVRLWHWINAASITVLALTGYFIGQPLPTMPGEASAHYLMGYIRFAHFTAGYLLAVGLIGRAYWALVGNHHAREIFWVPIFQKAYWKEVLTMFKWYAFLIPRPGRYVGHNPLARLAMFAGFLMLTLFMIVTGFALYGEGSQMGSWQEQMFGWVIPLMGQSQDVHTWHHLGMWAMVVFVIAHIYAAVREDIAVFCPDTQATELLALREQQVIVPVSIVDRSTAALSSSYTFTYAAGVLDGAANALAREIADNTSAISVAMTRAMMWRLPSGDHPMDAHRIDSRAIYRLSRGQDAKEGIASFLEKRAPQYRGKVSEDMPDFYPWWEEAEYR